MNSVRVWSLPVTKEKALKLWDLLERKISPAEAQDALFSLLGHEDLYAQFEGASPHEDVRPYILATLKEMLWNSPPCYRKAWQEDAWKICEAALYQRRLNELSA